MKRYQENEQTMLIAGPLRALINLVCLRKLSWNGMAWVIEGIRIDPDLLSAVSPPDHSLFEYTYLDFPLDFEICNQDLSSNFALKLHAILCRPYVKGRDWYDFNWYIKKHVPPNLRHLQSALDQWGLGKIMAKRLMANG